MDRQAEVACPEIILQAYVLSEDSGNSKCCSFGIYNKMNRSF
jgi:hypothetical protein